ncbi:MAG: hypothetical protein A3D52_01265 [Candidatus Taylorbacteria bacterium RIFCSPHIGHO2_02_FULL_44_36]|nr:MAG: hypothetical protein A3D52_01265 [Candidatus Taylorbacteria bacterium RIFCSPHIGHO2_02_FULL_44_36]OHA38889.1 MAG: hypothetical protein A3I97_01385 [Candidatus Taylorbacteria bacterium RIFCSPLOWO2_02_FULL_44_35]
MPRREWLNPKLRRIWTSASRLKNLRGAFAVSESPLGRNIIVVDDVATTGATLSEARKTLRRAGAKKILGIALAH